MKAVILGTLLLFSQLQAGPKVVAKFGPQNCPWSEELKKEVWETSSFQALLQGAGLKREESIPTSVNESLPVLILISETGEEIGRLGFLPIPPEKYVDLLKEMLSVDTLSHALSSLDTTQLLHLYRKAQLLHMTKSEKAILREGLIKDSGVDFLLAKYATLVEAHPRKARSIKKEIRLRQEKTAPIEWELALLNFEAHKNPQTLQKFLKRFEHSEYTWKCHFLLAEYYLGQREEEKGRFHVDEVRRLAPEEFKKLLD